MTTDNQSGSDSVSITWLSGAITGYGNEAAAATELQGQLSAGRKAQEMTDHKNRVAGSLCANPTNTAVNFFGGSTNVQVNVGARQW